VTRSCLRFAYVARLAALNVCREDGPYSQYHTTITPVPPKPNTSVPPDAATEMLIRFSRPTSLANADASAQSFSQDLLELSKMRC
jgi:hypothetical protein